MTIPIIARHTRDIDGRPLIEIDAIGRRITFCAELSAAELRELARRLVAIANDADQGATGRRVYPEASA
jgi:hypothetical protein